MDRQKNYNIFFLSLLDTLFCVTIKTGLNIAIFIPASNGRTGMNIVILLLPVTNRQVIHCNMYY